MCAKRNITINTEEINLNHLDRAIDLKHALIRHA